ncbi:heavy metal transporter [Streptomyces sp. NPDC050560]|uniref:heavy metal transporter n=1 Tax=Streptomyces sp. NPDC050560 TaxID=3365630 RepID=UPI003792F953
MPESSFFRAGRLLRAGAAFVVLIALAGYLVAQYTSGRRAQARCQVVSGGDRGPSYQLTAEQAVNAATISAVGTSRGMPGRAVTIALATALQESGLRNLPHGDRDSLGLFQQRPSQGWGTKAQIMDPAYAAGQFYAHLAKVPQYTALPLTEAAQRVQRSGFPDAYAKHEPDARLLAAAFTGQAPGTLSCRGDYDGTPGDPAKVRRALVRDFGSAVLAPVADASPAGGAAGAAGHPAPSKTPSATPVPGTVTVPVAPGNGQEQRRGWELAHWAVANSSALGIRRVDYAGRRWSAGQDTTDVAWPRVPAPRDTGQGASGPGKSAGGGTADSYGQVRIATAP